MLPASIRAAHVHLGRRYGHTTIVVALVQRGAWRLALNKGGGLVDFLDGRTGDAEETMRKERGDD